MNLKAKIYIYVNSTIQRCSNKINKIFQIEDFFSFVTSVSDTGGSTLSCEYLRDFWKKLEMVIMGYSGAGGKLIHKKKPEAKNLVTLSL